VPEDVLIVLDEAYCEYATAEDYRERINGLINKKFDHTSDIFKNLWTCQF
jgi:histidinol-phosphate/aromatic aminotransferase/cobyric acid decarboxylase-like protein